MFVLATDWPTVWLMAGIGIAVVFTILVLLVLVLQIFTVVAKKTTKAVKQSATAVKSAVACPITPEEEEQAALATAIYLYQEYNHDQESGMLTIHQPEFSLWHEELNERL